MKKVVILILLVALPTVMFGQDKTSATANEDTKTTVETSTESKETKEVKASETLSFEAKVQVMNLNHKKSNDIISINAYKKSLQIKVKSVKVC